MKKISAKAKINDSEKFAPRENNLHYGNYASDQNLDMKNILRKHKLNIHNVKLHMYFIHVNFTNKHLASCSIWLHDLKMCI